MASLTHRYIPRHRYIPQTAQTEENLFIEEYYSSTDTKIYIDDIEQTEISYISYSLNEQLKPIYGYASNTFDDVAIGSRIVTGIFKTPICNSSPQSTVEDIQARALSATYGDSSPDFDDYNKTESERVDNTDWVGNTNKTPGTSDSGDSAETSTPENSDEWYEYRNKLELLGFLPEGNNSDYLTTEALKAFQRLNNIEGDNGKLTTRTKEAIDNAIVQKSVESAMTVPVGTMIYNRPNRNTPMEANGTTEELKVFLMGAFEGESGELEWLYVTTADASVVGFININDNPDFKAYLLSSPPVYA